MRKINLWESVLAKEFQYFSNYEDYFAFLDKQKEDFSYRETNFYNGTDEPSNFLERMCNEQQVEIHLTDENHNISYNDYLGTYINPDYVRNNPDFIKAAQSHLLKNKYLITIYKSIFTNDFFQIIIKENPTASLYFYDFSPSDEQIKILKEHFITAYVINNGIKIKVSSSNIVEHYDYSAIKNGIDIMIETKSITEDFLDKLNVLTSNKILISIKPELNEIEQYNQLAKVVNKLEKLGKNNSVKFDVFHRSEFNKSDLAKSNYKGLVLKNDLHEYSIDEYKQEDAKLENLIKNIKNADLSPFEKYLAVYNIVKNFKPYKENEEDKNQSRYLKYILDNDYMVCVGYAKLLETLLERVGINAMEMDVSVDTSYDKGFSQEEKTVNFAGHARVLFKLTDPKYGIDGIYIADPTWDNDLENERLNHAIMTFEDTTIERRMQKLDNLDFLFNVNNFAEYNEKINALIKKTISRLNIKDIKDCYSNIYLIIVDTLKFIDPTYYKTLMSKKNIDMTKKEYEDFFTEFGEYVVKYSNKTIPKKILYEANLNMKTQINEMNKKELEEYRQKIIEYNSRAEKFSFNADAWTPEERKL